MNRELQLRESTQLNGDVWGSQRQSGERGLHKRTFKSSVGAFFMAVRGEERRESIEV